MLSAPRFSGGPWIMGVLNVTPDSFSDGGAWSDTARALAHAETMLAAGADVIDVGGESTRPGAAPVSETDEIARVVPVIAALRQRSDAPISVDTMKPAVAARAIAAGATIWNDVTGFRADGAVEVAGQLKPIAIVMHMQGEPETMQKAPRYGDVVTEVIAFLKARVAALETAGVTDIWVDPGIGFGKTLHQNIALMHALPRLRTETGKPVLFGASRKSFIGKIETRDGVEVSPENARLGGSLAAALFAANKGADMLRVHDVAETVQALRVARAIGEGA